MGGGTPMIDQFFSSQPPAHQTPVAPKEGQEDDPGPYH